MAANVELPPQTNQERQASALRRRINRQHRWRQQVAAECELRIRAMQVQLDELGAERLDLEFVDVNSAEVADLLALSSSADEDQ